MNRSSHSHRSQSHNHSNIQVKETSTTNKYIYYKQLQAKLLTQFHQAHSALSGAQFVVPKIHNRFLVETKTQSNRFCIVIADKNILFQLLKKPNHALNTPRENLATYGSKK